MGQVNRYIKDNPALDDVDHALGRPYEPFNTYRNYYATDCPDKISDFQKSPWWNVTRKKSGLTYCFVSDEGRKALAEELSDRDKYGRLYEITSKRYEGSKLVFAKTPSQANYRAWIDADLDDWSFMEYCAEISARLANKTRTAAQEAE